MLPHDELADLPARFLRFADEAGMGSPLYARLSAVAADDPVAVELLAAAPSDRQRRANLLFAAVHDVLLAGTDHPLAGWYPSVGGDRPPEAAGDDAFGAFLRDHRDAVAARVATRATQTNEVGRCAALWPAVRWAAAGPGRPVTLVELGASAGLLLHLDRYRYVLGEAVSGDPASPVAVAPRLHGPPPPELAAPVIRRRVGIDAAPLDPTDAGDRRWLEACLWPEQTGRIARLQAALGVAGRHDDVEVVVGDLVERLPDVLATVPGDHLPLVVHSAAVAYLDAAARDALHDLLAAAGAGRDLAVVSFEGRFLEPFRSRDAELAGAPAGERFLAGASVWRDGRRRDELLARAHPHGAWLQWLGPPPATGHPPHATVTSGG
jgi:hypothetical protein